jgi:hypothetical protein
MSQHTHTLRRIHLSGPDLKTQSLTIRLDLEKNGHAESISSEISCDALMYLMKAIQDYQIRNKLQIPHILRPKRKPSLSIVSE